MATKIKYNILPQEESTFGDLLVGDFFFAKTDGYDTDTGIAYLRQKVSNADNRGEPDKALSVLSGEYYGYVSDTKVIKVSELSIQVKL